MYDVINPGASLVTGRMTALLYHILSGLNIKDDKIEQHLLTTVEPLVDSTTSYTLRINADKTDGRSPVDLLLGKNDAFVPAGLRMSVMKRATAGTGSEKQDASLRAYTYPDKLIFPAAAERTQLFALFNSALTMKINGSEFWRKNTTRSLLYVPAVQESATQHAQTGNISDYADFVPFYKNVVMDGGTENTFEIKMPLGTVTPAISDGAKNAIRLDILGYLIKDGAATVDNMLQNLSNSGCGTNFVLFHPAGK